MFRVACLAAMTLALGQVPEDVAKKLPGKGKIEWDVSAWGPFWKAVDARAQTGTLILTLELGQAPAAVITKHVKSGAGVNVLTRSGGFTSVVTLFDPTVRRSDQPLAFQTTMRNLKPASWVFQDPAGKELAKGPLQFEFIGRAKVPGEIRSGERVLAGLKMPPAAVVNKTAKVVLRTD